MKAWQKIEALKDKILFESEDYCLQGVDLTESSSMSEHRSQQLKGNGTKNPAAQNMNRMMFNKANR